MITLPSLLAVLVLHTYLQVSFGNASFLDTELKVLHLPVQQKIILIIFFFNRINNNIQFSASLTDAHLLSSSSWFSKSTFSLSAASTKVRNWSILASIFNTQNSVYRMP